jgi:hypothetical protein
MPAPTNPTIYHITAVSNLPSIISCGRLWSDSQRIKQGFVNTNIGYSHIKQRRLVKPVTASVCGCLGDYVPFYFCNRSVMLYVISLGHADFKAQQHEVIHLVSAFDRVVASGRPWAFTRVNASAAYGVSFFDSPEHFDTVDWDAMPLRDWRGCREQRQAEFLVHDWFPWTCVTQIGVHNQRIRGQVLQILAGADHKPAVTVEPSWYY